MAELRLTERNQRTVLFVDEIHRFNKAQQDALLAARRGGHRHPGGRHHREPVVRGDRGAAVAHQGAGAGAAGARRTCAASWTRRWPTPSAGLGGEQLDCPPEVRDLIAREARGDARRALSTLEAAAAVPRPDAGRRAPAGHARRWRRRWPARRCSTTRRGDEHYNVVSAFIKSLRGTDPDAAVYWMARMLEAGEDPAVRPAADGDLRGRGRGQRRPAGAGGGGGGAGGLPPGGPARGRPGHDPGGAVPGHRAQEQHRPDHLRRRQGGRGRPRRPAGADRTCATPRRR